MPPDDDDPLAFWRGAAIACLIGAAIIAAIVAVIKFLK